MHSFNQAKHSAAGASDSESESNGTAGHDWKQIRRRFVAFIMMFEKISTSCITGTTAARLPASLPRPGPA